MNLKIQKIKADHGFGTVCKIDAGYYSQGFFSILSCSFNCFNLKLNFTQK